MLQITPEQDVVDQLVAWGMAHPLIRAMILTSSRARPDGPVDPLSDYDLILVVSDVGLFAFEDAWISVYDSRWSGGAIRAWSTGDHVFSGRGLSELCQNRFLKQLPPFPHQLLLLLWEAVCNVLYNIRMEVLNQSGNDFI